MEVWKFSPKMGIGLLIKWEGTKSFFVQTVTFRSLVFGLPSDIM